MAKNTSQFPLKLYVRREEDGKDHYFLANEHLDEAGDDGPCAIYDLSVVRQLKTRRSLE